MTLSKRKRRSFQAQIHGDDIYFDIEIKGQGHTKVINVRDTSYHGNTLTFQTKYEYVVEVLARTQSHVINPINLTMSSNQDHDCTQHIPSG